MFKFFKKVARKTSKSAGNHEFDGVFIPTLMSSTNSKSSDSESNKAGYLLSTSSIPASESASSVGKFLGVNDEALPSFREVPTSEKQNLFIKKLRLCCNLFDFADPTKSIQEKEIKRLTLLELVEYASSATVKFTEPVIQEVMKMVSANLFREFTPLSWENKLGEGFDLEEEETSMDPAWPHLQIVYEFLLRFVASPETDVKLAKKYIDHSFILKLLDLFQSEDPREREYLKTILHRIYGKFMATRAFIRKAINDVFYEFVFETENHNGIAELLDILGSIINGFAVPLKEEHKLFLVRVLIPLHKPKCLAVYHQQLSYCITQFVEKDRKLADSVTRGLIKHWPKTNSPKEVLFLIELEEVLEITQPLEFQRFMVPLFHQLAHCLNSLHFQVAERALFMWSNDHIEKLIKQNRKVILPIIFPALERSARSRHWNQAVQGLVMSVRKVFSDLDPKLYRDCLLKFEAEEFKKDKVKARREATWKHLEEIANNRSSKSLKEFASS